MPAPVVAPEHVCLHKEVNTSNNSHSQPAAILYKIYTVSDVVYITFA